MRKSIVFGPSDTHDIPSTQTLLAEPRSAWWKRMTARQWRRICNAVLGVVFFLLTIGVWIETAQGTLYEVPVYMVFWSRGASDDGSATTTTMVVQTWIEHLRLGYLLVVFLGLAGVDHVCMALWHHRYEAQLQAEYNNFRWFEFSITPAAMMVLIAMLSGVLDAVLLIVVIACTTGCMWLGLPRGFLQSTSEPHANAAPRQQPYITMEQLVAWVLFLSAWFVIFIHFGMNVAHATGAGVPSFVIAIVVVMFCLMCLFGINQARPASSFYSREHVYLALSPIAKMTLAGLAYGGMRTR